MMMDGNIPPDLKSQFRREYRLEDRQGSPEGRQGKIKQSGIAIGAGAGRLGNAHAYQRCREIL